MTIMSNVHKFIGQILFSPTPGAQLVAKINDTTNYYEILGVGRKSSVEEIKNAYKRVSFKVHPNNNNARGAKKAYKKVDEALCCLIDEGSRRCYDKRCEIRECEKRTRMHESCITLVTILVIMGGIWYIIEPILRIERVSSTDFKCCR
ncbi:hypothetical protein CTI12_AA045110 [Artemisia annua]|uniref:J domain-containing protein n=1 Tax=Artemisia annua TaxID=35608 RepID=A0A2U1QD98_ARTAN|nr:hypothetical protein CTI12_AA045110 [Artemisia annua]